MTDRERERVRGRWHREIREEGEERHKDLKKEKWREGKGGGGEEMVPAHRGKRNPCLFQQSHISALFNSVSLVQSSLTFIPGSQTFHICKNFSVFL